MMACENKGCARRYCEHCLTTQLKDNLCKETSSSWVNGLWMCPVCRYISISIYVCMYTYCDTSLSLSLSLSLSMYMHMYGYIHYVFVYIYIYINVYIHTYMCLYIYIGVSQGVLLCFAGGVLPQPQALQSISLPPSEGRTGCEEAGAAAHARGAN